MIMPTCGMSLLLCVFVRWTPYTAATPFQVSNILKKYEEEFFTVVEPRLSLLKLIRKSVITKDVESRINASRSDEAQEILYDHLMHHGSVDTLKEYCEVAMGAEGYPRMQILGRKMMEELQQGGWLELCACVL